VSAIVDICAAALKGLDCFLDHSEWQHIRCLSSLRSLCTTFYTKSHAGVMQDSGRKISSGGIHPDRHEPGRAVSGYAVNILCAKLLRGIELASNCRTAAGVAQQATTRPTISQDLYTLR
jgi:hypothetical protein